MLRSIPSKGLLIKYVRNSLEDGGSIQNAYSCVKGEGMSKLICTYALTLSLFVFLFELVTRGFELVTRGFDLENCGFKPVSRGL